MKRGPRKNGSGNANIVVDDKNGWARVFAPSPEELSDDELPIALSECLREWMRRNPTVRLLTTLAIPRDGNIIAIHAFYERVI
jgi:hypothetical protein